MIKHIRPADLAVALIAFLAFVVLMLIEARFNNTFISIFVFATILASLVFVVLVSVRRVQQAVDNSQERIFDFVEKTADERFEQLEAILGIYHTLQPVVPLKSTRGWAASPDFLRLLMHTIKADRPECIVEASSGVSTVVSAYCLKQIGRGHVFALEHESGYAQATRNQIALHGLDDFATVIDAPLRKYQIQSDEWLWYDTTGLNFDGNIDLLVIDGPPKNTQPLARYPALPLLEEHVSGISKILMDDAARRDEQEIVRRWKSARSAMVAKFIPLEKGAFELQLD